MMKNKSFLIYFQFLTLSLVVLCVLFIPIYIYAGTFYNCIDEDGNETLSDYPVGGQRCTQVRTHEGRTNVQRDDNALEQQQGSIAVSSSDKITSVVIRGNSVLVPVKIMYGGNIAHIHLLLDTGASGTTIHSEIADRLALNLNDGKRAVGRVVGGGFISASVVKIDSLTVGPYTVQDWNVCFIPHNGFATSFDGLLGMDVLRELNYRIDFKKKAIIWD
jgi:clan AA aspartic protease (TIGR02281 family)